MRYPENPASDQTTPIFLRSSAVSSEISFSKISTRPASGFASALTVKKAYDGLEQEGFIMTVHGKGSFVTCSGQDIYLEERRREVEEELAAAVRKGRSCGMEQEELLELFQMVLEEP